MRLVRDCAGPAAVRSRPTRLAADRRRAAPTDGSHGAGRDSRKEARSLRGLLGRGSLVSIVESDGYAALKAQLPPRENRGLVLIDPPYESDQEFDRVLAALELGSERWPTGMYCVWYPLTERAAPVRFRRDLERSGIRECSTGH